MTPDDEPDEATLWSGRLRSWPAAAAPAPDDDDLPDETTRLSRRDVPDDATVLSGRYQPDDATVLSGRHEPDDATALSAKHAPDDETVLSSRNVADDETVRSVGVVTTEAPVRSARPTPGETALGFDPEAVPEAGVAAETVGARSGAVVEAPNSAATTGRKVQVDATGPGDDVDDDTSVASRRSANAGPVGDTSTRSHPTDVPDDVTIARPRSSALPSTDVPDDVTIARPRSSALPPAEAPDDVTIARRSPDVPDDVTVVRPGSPQAPDDATARTRGGVTPVDDATARGSGGVGSPAELRRSAREASTPADGHRAARVPDAGEREIYRPRADGAVRVERAQPVPRPPSGDAAAVRPRPARRGAGRAVLVIAIAVVLVSAAGIAFALLAL